MPSPLIVTAPLPAEAPMMPQQQLDVQGLFSQQNMDKLNNLIKDLPRKPMDVTFSGLGSIGLAVGGYLNKVVVTGTRIFKSFKKLFDGYKTNTIVWGSSLLLGFLYAFYASGWEILNVDPAQWILSTMFVSIFSRFINDKLNSKEIAQDRAKKDLAK